MKMQFNTLVTGHTKDYNNSACDSENDCDEEENKKMEKEGFIKFVKVEQPEPYLNPDLEKPIEKVRKILDYSGDPT